MKIIEQTQPARFDKAVVFCCDSNYLPYASFVAYQVAVLHPERDFDILICSNEELRLPPALTETGILFQRLQVDERFQGLAVKHLPRSAYLRLWLPSAFRETYKRMLYLDCDVYLEAGGLDRLLDADLGVHSVGAVRDMQQWLRPNKHVREFRVIGAGPAPYMNTGVLLIDTTRFEGGRVLERCLSMALEYGDAFPRHDQSILNATLHRQWAELSPVWNWQWAGKRPLWGSIAAPIVSHFAGHAKPWRDPEGLCPPRYQAAINDFAARLFNEHELTPCAEGKVLRSGRGFTVAALEHLLIRRSIETYLNRFTHDLDVKT